MEFVLKVEKSQKISKSNNSSHVYQLFAQFSGSKQNLAT